jgi:DMSO/TMAO reductase YedYZ molybdopterin-dependent catalytic subunit
MSGSGRNDQQPLTKLTRSKQDWARERRFLTGRKDPAARLPAGQHVVTNWPVLDLGLLPTVTPARFELQAIGAVEQPLRWDWQTFMAQPQTDDVSDIHCVTTWSRYDNRWTGVAMRHLLALVRPKPEARFVTLHSYDGYTTNLPLSYLDDADVLIAHSWEGRPLSPEHGGPVRLVVPKLYFWKSAKWLRRIEFRAVDRPGFWEEQGYHDQGDPWSEERYRE